MKRAKTHRSYTPEFKLQVIEEFKTKGLDAVIQAHGLHNSLLYKWRREVAQGKFKSVAPEQRTSSRSGVSLEQKRAAVAEYEAGGRAKTIAAKLGVSDAALYQWRDKLRASNGHDAPGTAVVISAKAMPIDVSGQQAQREATIFLRHAKRELLTAIRTGKIDELDQAHLYALLALNSLQGN
jgi:transposase-like protein